MASIYDRPTPAADVFDAGLYPPTWDFFTWIVNAELFRIQNKVAGPFRVRFRTSGLHRNPNPTVHRVWRQLLNNVCKKILPLFDAVEDNAVRFGNGQWYNYKRLHKAAENGFEIPKVKVPHRPEKGKLVLTLREAPYTEWRNSILTNWIDFARRRQQDGYNIVFVRDTAKAYEPLEDFETAPLASMNVQDRVDLYSTAECNILVANGPASILWFSEYPFINYNPMHHHPEQEPTFPHWWEEHAGIRPPQQFAWFNKKQRIEWMLDTPENLEMTWKAWLRNG